MLNTQLKGSQMAKIDLAGYTLGELKGLQNDVERAIKDRQQQEVQSARDQILAIAKDAGVTVEKLLGNGKTKAKKANGKKVEAKYQNPKDTSQIWTGRGRQPRWMAEAIASGEMPDDFLIK
jgi:DNA-binding protein H-NS